MHRDRSRIAPEEQVRATAGRVGGSLVRRSELETVDVRLQLQHAGEGFVQLGLLITHAGTSGLPLPELCTQISSALDITIHTLDDALIVLQVEMGMCEPQ